MFLMYPFKNFTLSLSDCNNKKKEQLFSFKTMFYFIFWRFNCNILLILLKIIIMSYIDVYRHSSHV